MSTHILSQTGSGDPPVCSPNALSRPLYPNLPHQILNFQLYAYMHLVRLITSAWQGTSHLLYPC